MVHTLPRFKLLDDFRLLHNCDAAATSVKDLGSDPCVEASLASQAQMGAMLWTTAFDFAVANIFAAVFAQGMVAG